MNIKEFTARLNKAVDGEKYKAQSVRGEIVVKTAEGDFYQVNNVQWNEDAEEWQIHCARL